MQELRHTGFSRFHIFILPMMHAEYIISLRQCTLHSRVKKKEVILRNPSMSSSYVSYQCVVYFVYIYVHPSLNY